VSSRQGFRDVCTSEPPKIDVERQSRPPRFRDRTPESDF
jgi:hypothetical protein